MNQVHGGQVLSVANGKFLVVKPSCLIMQVEADFTGFSGGGYPVHDPLKLVFQSAPGLNRGIRT